MSFAQKLAAFLGVSPRTADRLLPDMGATIAENVNLTSGEIRPIRPPLSVFSPTPIEEKLTAYRAYDGVTEKWRAWPIIVDVVKAPLSPSVEARYYWTGDSCARYCKFSEFGTTEYALGIPNPTGKPAASASGGVGSTISRSYCYTFYQPSTGEESGSSPVADSATGKVDGTWTISGFTGTPANTRAANWNTSGLYMRLYRTTGTTGSWQLVAERAVSTADWTDTLTDSQILGDELVTATWLPPPDGLTCLGVLPNGAMYGAYKNQLCLSEPFQPHAWPIDYRFEAESDIVGISNFGTTIVVCTKTRPYIADGVTPDVVTMQSSDNTWPCLSKRSVCSVGDGVVFATTNGLAYVGMSGQDILTKSLFTKEEWTPLNPPSIGCRMANGRLYMLFTPVGAAVAQLYRLDIGEPAQLTTLSGDCNSLYVDPQNGNLYLVDKDIYLYDGYYGKRNVWTWKSKEFTLPGPVNIGAAQIDFESTMSAAEISATLAAMDAAIAANQAIINAKTAVGALNQIGFDTDPIGGAIGIATPPSPSEYLQYTLYSRGQAVAFVNVISGKPFRLPSGYKSDRVSHQLVGNVKVSSIRVAETMGGLGQV